MNITLIAKKEATAAQDTTPHKIRFWLLTWEIYPIILVAAFFRLYGLNTTAFGGDQSVLFTMAYDAVHRGLLPVTSNGASIFIWHQPIAIYFLMLPVLFSPDPLWAAIMTALFNVVAVLITYIFTRRYFGRFAATIASLLFATAETAIVFSRFIWQPTLLGPFVMLFFFALFWGVVERRKGWFFPALVLLGVIYQLHEITIILAIPLLLALLLSPQTVRPRDIVLAGIALLLIFAPYLVWEITTKFADVHTILSLSHTQPHIDTKALAYYQRFLNAYYYDDRFLGSSYYDPVGSTTSLVFKILPLLVWTRQILFLLLLASFVMAAALIARSRHTTAQNAEEVEPNKQQSGVSLLFTHLYSWWRSLRADPVRCGFVILLAWQIVPLLALSRHIATIHLHYLLMILPGPFILIGFFITRLLSWLQQKEPARLLKGLHYGTFTLTTLVLIIQLMGSTASLVDTTRGINNHIFGYNDLGSLQSALHEADQVAQQHHLSRIYISMNGSGYDNTLTSLPILAQQIHTPTTLFDAANCLILPSVSKGSAVLLTKSFDSMATALLSRFATATLVDRPPLLGTSPFQLYIVTPTKQPATAYNGFINHLQPSTEQAQQMKFANSLYLVTRWTLLHNEQPASFTSYTYILRATPLLPILHTIRSDCLLTAMRDGDQMVIAFHLSQARLMPFSFKITSQFQTVAPHTITMGPLKFEAYNMQSRTITLQTADGSNAINLSTGAGL